MSEEEIHENEIEEEKEDKKAPILIALVILFLFIVAAIAYFSVTSLNAPSNVRAVVEGNSVVLLWDGVEGETIVGYRVYRASEENGPYVAISDVVEETSYIDSGLEKGTYYYIVRSVDEEGRESPDSEKVEVVIGNYPTGIDIILGNGSYYINESNVEATLKANDAKECKVSVNGEGGEWFNYQEKIRIELREGENKIEVQCRNDAGNSEKKEKEVYVDTNSPDVSLSMVSQKDKEITLLFSLQDETDLSCSLSAEGVEIDRFGSSPGSFEKSYTLEYGAYPLVLVCYDKAGNKGEDSLEVVVEKQEEVQFDFFVLINGGDVFTSSRVVSVEVIGENIESCRYTNENIYPDYKTDWLPYKEKKTWELSPGEGTKTVYVECSSKDGSIVEKSASITYKRDRSDDNPPARNETSNETSNETTNQTNQTNYTAYPKSVKIIGYVIRGDSLVMDENVAASSNVKVEISSEYAEFSKLWNTPYVYEGVELNLPDVVDREEEAPWDTITNGVVDFELIPKKKYSLNGAISVDVQDGIREVNFKVKNSNGESNTIKDTIFYDATSPRIDSLEYQLVQKAIGNSQVSAVMFNIIASDNGDEFGFGVYGIKYKRYSCVSNCDDLSNFVFDKVAEFPFSPVFYDYPLEEGKTYKYKIYVSDYAGHYSSKKKVFVKVDGNYSNETNITNGSITFFYLKDDQEHLLSEGDVINTPSLLLRENGYDMCNVYERLDGNPFLLGSGNDEVYFNILDESGWHNVFAVCYKEESTSTKEVSFFYDNVPPKLTVYAKPTRNNTIKIKLKAKDNYELSNISLNSTYVLINVSCLKEQGLDIDELPYSRDPLIYYPSQCFEFNSELIYVNNSLNGKRFKKYFEINPVISDKEIKVLYIFVAEAYDKAGNYNQEVSNPVISHPICYKYDLDFCYFEGKVKRFSEYVKDFLLNQEPPAFDFKIRNN